MVKKHTFNSHPAPYTPSAPANAACQGGMVTANLVDSCSWVRRVRNVKQGADYELIPAPIPSSTLLPPLWPSLCPGAPPAAPSAFVVWELAGAFMVLRGCMGSIGRISLFSERILNKRQYFSANKSEWF
jgi:hypothetical protein